MSDKVVSIGAKKNRKKEKEKEQKAEKITSAESQNTDENLVYCSFCGRPNTQVIKMVQGPGVNICSECTMIAVQYLILNDRMLSSEAQMILDAFWGKSKK